MLDATVPVNNNMSKDCVRTLPKHRLTNPSKRNIIWKVHLLKRKMGKRRRQHSPCQRSQIIQHSPCQRSQIIWFGSCHIARQAFLSVVDTQKSSKIFGIKQLQIWSESTKKLGSYLPKTCLFFNKAVFSFKIFLSKFHYSPITSNLLTHAWSIKYR